MLLKPSFCDALRGTCEAGSAFAGPTYVHVFIGLMVVVGFREDGDGPSRYCPHGCLRSRGGPGHADGLAGLAAPSHACLLLGLCAALTVASKLSRTACPCSVARNRNAATTLAMLGMIAASMMISSFVLFAPRGVMIVEDPAAQLTLDGPLSLRRPLLTLRFTDRFRSGTIRCCSFPSPSSPAPGARWKHCV